MYLDAPQGVALTYKGYPQAIMGFIKPPDEESLKIVQLQGVLYSYRQCYKHRNHTRTDYLEIPARTPKGVNSIDYKKLFVKVAEDLARFYGLQKVEIQSAWNNRYTKRLSIGLPFDRAKQIYDATALAMGYSEDQKISSDFYKPL